MKRERRSLGSRTVLSGIIAAAVASVFTEGCGGEVRSTAREDASVLGDGAPHDAPVRCSLEAGIVSTTIVAGDLDGSSRPPLWLTTYSVDPTCWRGIAADELRHAALSWRIARWLDIQLDAAGRARVVLARLRALAVLDEELTRAPPRDDVLGLPDRDGQRRLLAALRATLKVGDLAIAA